MSLATLLQVSRTSRMLWVIALGLIASLGYLFWYSVGSLWCSVLQKHVESEPSFATCGGFCRDYATCALRPKKIPDRNSVVIERRSVDSTLWLVAGVGKSAERMAAKRAPDGSARCIASPTQRYHRCTIFNDTSLNGQRRSLGGKKLEYQSKHHRRLLSRPPKTTPASIPWI